MIKLVEDLYKLLSLAEEESERTKINKYNHSDEYNDLLDRLENALGRIENGITLCKKANEQKYVYVKETYGIIKEKFLDDLDYEVLNNRLYVNSRGMYYDFPINGYGNWWALTREELEKDKSE